MRRANRSGVAPKMPHSGYDVTIATRPGSFDFPVVKPSNGDRRGGASASGLSSSIMLQAGALATLLTLSFAGAPLGGSAATTIACGAILLLGLPHGALDLEIIKRERRLRRIGTGGVLLLYLGLAAAMAAIWLLSPVMALSSFLVVSVIHFAEDWADLRSAFLAQGMAIAVLTAPALLHLAELEILFEALSGRSEAALIANVMLLMAPMSVAVASLAIWMLWRRGCHGQAVAGALTLAGMILLPPVIGFALFFCLFHSPRHFRDAVSRVAAAPPALAVAALITCAALGIAAAVFAGQVRADLPSQFVAATFMTLSLLTVPHMIVPAVIGALGAVRTGAVVRCDQTIA